jgi:hypothetical protein
LKIIRGILRVNTNYGCQPIEAKNRLAEKKIDSDLHTHCFRKNFSCHFKATNKLHIPTETKLIPSLRATSRNALEMRKQMYLPYLIYFFPIISRSAISQAVYQKPIGIDL